MVVDARRDHSFRVPRPDLYEVVVRVTWTDGSTQNSFQMTRLLRQKS